MFILVICIILFCSTIFCSDGTFVGSRATPSELTTYTTWAWGPPVDKDMIAWLGDNLDIKGFLEFSFVRLGMKGRAFSIELVQKSPLTWPTGSPFCTRVVPVTMYEFLKMHGKEIIDFDMINVILVSDQPIKACSWYVRTMVMYGFSDVKNEHIDTPELAAEFCEEFAKDVLFFSARPPQQKVPILPELDPQDRAIINDAVLIYTRIK